MIAVSCAHKPVAPAPEERVPATMHDLAEDKRDSPTPNAKEGERMQQVGSSNVAVEKAKDRRNE